MFSSLLKSWWQLDIAIVGVLVPWKLSGTTNGGTSPGGS